MKVTRLTTPVMGSNCYVLVSDRQAVIIDPMPSKKILEICEAENAELIAILLTHGHFDHMLGLDFLREQAPNAKIMIHVDDAELMRDGQKNAFYNFYGRSYDFGEPDRLLIKGDEIQIGKKVPQVVHTPGHTKGSVCYKVGNILFTGDTVMENGYGRCDLYSGDDRAMSYTLKQLYELSYREPQIIIYPGHGKPTLLSDAINNIYNK